MEKKIIIRASLFCCIAVCFGAFGGHALKKILTVEELVSWETGVRYLFYHGLAIFLLLPLKKITTEKKQRQVLILFTTGTLLFSLSIFLLCLQNIMDVKLSFLGPLTPIGGSLLILGWIFLLIEGIKIKRSNEPE